MTAADALLDLRERLTEANTRLLALAHENRFKPEIARDYIKKAEGVRLGLSYVEELQGLAGVGL